MSYCIDSSSLLEASARRYPVENFPTFWERLEALAVSGRLKSSLEVFLELEKRDDGMSAWATRLKDQVFIEIDDPVQGVVTDLLARSQRMLDTSKGKNAADPFVVAVAKTRGLTVVTEESPKALDRIPAACRLLSVPCISLLGLIQSEKWRF